MPWRSCGLCEWLCRGVYHEEGDECKIERTEWGRRCLLNNLFCARRGTAIMTSPASPRFVQRSIIGYMQALSGFPSKYYTKSLQAESHSYQHGGNSDRPCPADQLTRPGRARRTSFSRCCSCPCEQLHVLVVAVLIGRGRPCRIVSSEKGRKVEPTNRG